jgi:hypothetical protein
VKIVVYHGGHGCETGCCGHYVELYSDHDQLLGHRFRFDHPERGEDFRAWARELAEDFIGERFPDCLATIDWDTMEVTAMDTGTC